MEMYGMQKNGNAEEKSNLEPPPQYISINCYFIVQAA